MASVSRAGRRSPASPETVSEPLAPGRAQRHRGDSQSAWEMQLSGVSKEGPKLTPLLSEPTVFYMCWAPAYGPTAELRPPSSAKLILAPGALFESQKVWVLFSVGLEFSLSFSASWVESQKRGGMLRCPRSSRLKRPVPRILRGSCVTAGEIPTQEGWERQGLS